jgi:hypothetical protein
MSAYFGINDINRLSDGMKIAYLSEDGHTVRSPIHTI